MYDMATFSKSWPAEITDNLGRLECLANFPFELTRVSTLSPSLSCLELSFPISSSCLW